jgi:hypothetical protein
VSTQGSDLVEVLILGDLIVRKNGAELDSALPPALAETLVLLAAYGRPVLAKQVMVDHANKPAKGSLEQYIFKLKKHDLPVISGGPRGRSTYHLDARQCRIDAAEFVAGVNAGRDIDDLLKLWRGSVTGEVLCSSAWSGIKAARSRLIDRIAGLLLEEQLALTELARFAGLFPDDKELDAIRPRGKRSRPRLLVVEDNEQMMDEIRDTLKADYDIVGVPSRDAWRSGYRDSKGVLDLIDGALIDLHLTKLGNDFRGREIAKYLCEHTGIPAALITANSGERSDYKRRKNMEELRLVDIVSKQGEEWYEELVPTAMLLVGEGVTERQHRMRTWLAHTYRKVERDTDNAAPSSIEYKSRLACYRDYQAALAIVESGDLDAAQQAVDRFCTSSWTSR